MQLSLPLAPRRASQAAADLALVMGFSLFLRSFNLLLLPIFTDEATYLLWGMDIWEQKTRASLFIPILDDGKQPLFLWLVGAAGGLIPGDPLLGGRIVSVLASVAGTAAVYLAGLWLADRRVGLLAAGLYAVTPFVLFFDRMALMEPLMNAAGIWAFALGVYLATHGRAPGRALLPGALLGIAMGVALWTKMTALFIIAFPLLAVLLLSRPETRRAAAWGLAAGYAVLGLFIVVLAAMPESWRMVEKTQSFSISFSQLLGLPWELWRSNGLAYWSWFQAYLPGPLWALVLAAAVYGMLRRPRATVLLLGCWAVFTLPTILTALKQAYTTRYVVPGVFPLLILLALTFSELWERLAGPGGRLGGGISSLKSALAGAGLLLAVSAPSLAFDYSLLTAPETTPLADTDSYHYVAAWPSGYGFREAIEVAKERALAYTREGQPVIVLSDYPRGLPYDGIRVYMRNMPGVFHYVDGHLARDAGGFLAAWSPHGVPVIVIGNQGRADLESFEREVPQAKRLAVFPKPGGRSSYRVYEVSVADLLP